MFKWLGRLVGDSNEKVLRRLQPIVAKINALEPEIEAMSDAGMRARTEELRARFREQTEGDIADLDAEFEEQNLRDSAVAKEYQKRRRAIEDGVLDEMLPEAFALVREAGRRTIGQRHYDVQLIGGIVLHQGRISEMKTGEGKTLVASLPLFLNALAGRGAHLITVNDYLARVGGGWMGQIYHFLGMSVGVIAHEYSALFDPDYIDPEGNPHDQRLLHWRPCTRQEAYAADITYGTNNEFGFDYLRDNMVQKITQCSQRELHFAIVDEVDNILIDEARTPLIISGPSNKSSAEYQRFSSLVRGLKRSTVTQEEVKRDGVEPDGDYMIDERSKSVVLTEQGLAKIEERMRLPEGESIYDPQHVELTHFLDNAMKAEYLFHRDKEYMISPKREIVIVDEFTGRAMAGRRWSDGLHQAVEAKENVPIQNENVTLATITFQNYFRMYHKLGGMTGTALTESEEFNKIYSLEVVVIPTHRPMVREDLDDQVYKTEKAKFDAVVRDIEEIHQTGRPVLVGTTSIETSERVSKLLTAKGVAHTVLNAKFHESEAQIVAQAGRLGAVTIATNMAGRGTDILLGGNPDGLVEELLERDGLTTLTATPEQLDAARAEARGITGPEHDQVIEMGGLHIVGTERHDARRIDNQLRGRAGRQGDPGTTRFFLSLEDELMRRFGPMERVKNLMTRLGLEEDIPIEAGLINRAIESAQTKVEGYNFDIRKHLVEYDDVVNKQREIIYADRRAILEGEDMHERILDMIADEVAGLAEDHLNGDERDVDGFVRALITIAPTLKEREAGLKGDLAKIYDHNKAADLAIEAVEAAYEAQLEILAQEYDKTHAGGMQVQNVESGQEFIRYLERQVMLRSIDNEWIDYLTAMEDLRMNIGNMALAQRDPLVEFKRQGFTMFAELKENIQRTIVYDFLKNAGQWQRYLVEAQREAQRRLETAQAAGGSSSSVDEGTKTTTAAAARSAAAVRRAAPKVGRNDPCPCGSGKKFKVCHLGRESELGGAQAGEGGAEPAGKGPQQDGNGSGDGRPGAHSPKRSKGRNVPAR